MSLDTINQQASAQATSASDTIKNKVGEEEGCNDVADFLNSDAFKDLGQEITTNILNDLTGQNSYTCFEETLKEYEPSIIKRIDSLEIKNKNNKKNVYSNLIGLDIRIDYLKSLNSNIEKLNDDNNNNNGETVEEENKVLSYDEKNDINKRLSIFYNKNLDVLNIIYKILYYIYLSLFIIYFALFIFNFYMYKFKGNDEYYDKFKFTFIGTFLIVMIPNFLNYIFNKFMFF